MAFQWLSDAWKGFQGRNEYNPPIYKLDATKSDQERRLGEATRGQQEGYNAWLQNAMAGKGPSVAEQQLQAGRDQAIKAAAAQAAAARGGNVGLANRSAAQAQAGLTSNASRDAAMLRAQEQQNAAQMYGQELQGERAQDIMGRQASIEEEKANLEAKKEQEGLQTKITEGEATRGQGAIGGILGAISDERAKEDIRPMERGMVAGSPMISTGNQPAAGPNYARDLRDKLAIRPMAENPIEKKAEDAQQQRLAAESQKGFGATSSEQSGDAAGSGLASLIRTVAPAAVGLISDRRAKEDAHARGYEQGRAEQAGAEFGERMRPGGSFWTLPRAATLGAVAATPVLAADLGHRAGMALAEPEPVGTMRHLPVPDTRQREKEAVSDERQAAEYGKRWLERNRRDAMMDYMDAAAHKAATEQAQRELEHSKKMYQQGAQIYRQDLYPDEAEAARQRIVETGSPYEKTRMYSDIATKEMYSDERTKSRGRMPDVMDLDRPGDSPYVVAGGATPALRAGATNVGRFADVTPEQSRRDLAPMNAYTARYKPEFAEQMGTDTEPRPMTMAQEHLQSPMYKKTVYEAPNGYLALDPRKLLQANTAEIAGLDKRIREVEAKHRGDKRLSRDLDRVERESMRRMPR